MRSYYFHRRLPSLPFYSIKNPRFLPGIPTSKWLRPHRGPFLSPVIRSSPFQFRILTSSFFLLSRFSIVRIHNIHVSSSDFRFVLQTSPLSCYVYFDKSFFLKEYLPLSALLSYLTRPLTRCLKIRIHKLRFVRSLKTFSSDRVNMTRSSTTCPGFDKNHVWYPNVSNTLVGSPKTYENLWGSICLHWSTSALFQEDCAVQIPCPTLWFTRRVCCGYWGARKSERQSGEISRAQTTVLVNLTSAAVKMH